MQQFHKLRREVEKNVARLGTVNGGAQFKNSQLLQKAFHSHDHMRVSGARNVKRRRRSCC